ncbi:unnamed protein product [Caenorhabditis sp. 36 PRJEB53466]|nr:unnamed protein product [Caenorhabditis sp. 36 PRJEB53466]
MSLSYGGTTSALKTHCETKHAEIWNKLGEEKEEVSFWRSQIDNYSKLPVIAAELLASPASSSCSERTFSRCTDFIRQTKRNRATLDTMNATLTVTENCKKEENDAKTEELMESDEGEEEEFCEEDMLTRMVRMESENSPEDMAEEELIPDADLEHDSEDIMDYADVQEE